MDGYGELSGDFRAEAYLDDGCRWVCCYDGVRRVRKIFFLFLMGMLLSSAAAASQVTYIYTDPQGTPLAEVDNQGRILQEYDYRPYGQQALGPQHDGPGYASHVYDQDIGFSYMQARYYDPWIGRFASRDAVHSSPGDLMLFNGYAYANNSPAMHTDPTGNCVEDACIGEAIAACAAYVPCAAAVAAGAAYVSVKAVQVTQATVQYIHAHSTPVVPIVVQQSTEGSEEKDKSYTDADGNKIPFSGVPGSTVRGGTGSRTYGPDGYPQTDRDLPHPDEKGVGSEDHCHDWCRSSPGQPPRSGDRGMPRPPKAGDPPPPRGPNVPPPKDPSIAG